jgi:hypothetical protein
MADKYWMDILIRHESHPMVARLVAEARTQSGSEPFCGENSLILGLRGVREIAAKAQHCRG